MSEFKVLNGLETHQLIEIMARLTGLHIKEDPSQAIKTPTTFLHKCLFSAVIESKLFGNYSSVVYAEFTSEKIFVKIKKTPGVYVGNMYVLDVFDGKVSEKELLRNMNRNACHMEFDDETDELISVSFV